MNKIDVKCPKCGGDILEKKSQKGAKYFGCENNSKAEGEGKCDFMLWDKPTNEKCPVCGKMLAYKSIKKRITNIKVCIDSNCSYNADKPTASKKKTASKTAAKKTKK